MTRDPGADAQRAAAGPMAAEPDSGASSRNRVAGITALLVSTMLAVTMFQAPHQLFVRFAAMDSGGELAIQHLIGQGFRPGIDFGYPYGLLSLLVGRVWYGACGLSPGSFQGYVTVCMVASCWGLARLVVARRVGLAGLALVVLAIPDLLFVTYLTSVHTIEQALLINALAEQAKGRRGTALALLTACCFVKPSLAFVQGLVVLIAALAAAGTRRTDRAALVRSVVPPLVTALVLAAILAASFGPRALLSTLSPARGAAIYRANHYGFFHGQGRAFWILPGAGVRDYFRYEVGFWLLGTAALIAGGVAGVWRLARRGEAPERARDDEVIVTCAVVHVAFITLLFGHRVTWVYSLPMLVVGLALLPNRGRWPSLVVWGLAAALLVSDRSKGVATLGRRETEAPTKGTLGLWASRQERDEWGRALELARDQPRAVVFAMCEGAPLLFPGFAPPVVGYLVPGNLLPDEIQRKADQLAGASLIVSVYPLDWDGFEHFPTLRAAFAGCELIADGQFVRVYRRGPAPPTR